MKFLMDDHVDFAWTNLLGSPVIFSAMVLRNFIYLHFQDSLSDIWIYPSVTIHIFQAKQPEFSSNQH